MKWALIFFYVGFSDGEIYLENAKETITFASKELCEKYLLERHENLGGELIRDENKNLAFLVFLIILILIVEI